MSHIKMVVMVVLLMLGFCLDQVKAEPIYISISGHITDMWGSDAPLYADTFHIGDNFTGTYSYDTEAINTSPDPGWGVYPQNTPYGINVLLNGFNFKTSLSRVENYNIMIGYDPNPMYPNSFSRYIVESAQNDSLPNGLSVDDISWDLFDNTHAAISSISLTDSAPVIGDWRDNGFFIGCGRLPGGNSSLVLQGVITQAVLVPEPLTSNMLLLAIGLFIRRKKQTRPMMNRDCP